MPAIVYTEVYYTCENCRGTGMVGSWDRDDVGDCGSCDGYGRESLRVRRRACWACNATGSINGETCVACAGTTRTVVEPRMVGGMKWVEFHMKQRGMRWPWLAPNGTALI